eukprot:6172523-Pleurochrysis_carterae.AAC.1
MIGSKAASLPSNVMEAQLCTFCHCLVSRQKAARNEFELTKLNTGHENMVHRSLHDAAEIAISLRHPARQLCVAGAVLVLAALRWRGMPAEALSAAPVLERGSACRRCAGFTHSRRHIAAIIALVMLNDVKAYYQQAVGAVHACGSARRLQCARLGVRTHAVYAVETLLPSDLDEHALKQRYKQLAAQMHPDTCKTDDAVERFQALSEEYQTRLREKRQAQKNQSLGAAWVVLLAAAAFLWGTSNEPLMPALLVGGGTGILLVIQQQDEAKPLRFIAAAKPKPLGAGAEDSKWDKVGDALEDVTITGMSIFAALINTVADAAVQATRKRTAPPTPEAEQKAAGGDDMDPTGAKKTEE